MTPAVIRLFPLVITAITTLISERGRRAGHRSFVTHTGGGNPVGGAGSTVTVSIVNLAPAAAYDISILREIIPVPRADAPGKETFDEAVECAALGLAKGLHIGHR